MLHTNKRHIVLPPHTYLQEIIKTKCANLIAISTRQNALELEWFTKLKTGDGHFANRWKAQMRMNWLDFGGSSRPCAVSEVSVSGAGANVVTMMNGSEGGFCFLFFLFWRWWKEGEGGKEREREKQIHGAVREFWQKNMRNQCGEAGHIYAKLANIK